MRLHRIGVGCEGNVRGGGGSRVEDDGEVLGDAGYLHVHCRTLRHCGGDAPHEVAGAVGEAAAGGDGEGGACATERHQLAGDRIIGAIAHAHRYRNGVGAVGHGGRVAREAYGEDVVAAAVGVVAIARARACAIVASDPEVDVGQAHGAAGAREEAGLSAGLLAYGHSISCAVRDFLREGEGTVLGEVERLAAVLQHQSSAAV